MSSLSFGAFSFLKYFLTFTLHHTSVLESLIIFGTNWFIDIGTVAGVHAGALVLDHLVTALDGADVLVGGAVLPADWGELVVARTVVMGGLGPVEVVAGSGVRESNIGALESASGSIGDSVISANRVVDTIARTGRVGVRVLVGCKISVVRGLIGNSGDGGLDDGFGAPPI